MRLCLSQTTAWIALLLPLSVALAAETPPSLADQYLAALPQPTASASTPTPAPAASTPAPAPTPASRPAQPTAADDRRRILLGLGLAAESLTAAEQLPAQDAAAAAKILAGSPDLAQLMSLIALRNRAIQAALENLQAERARYDQADYLEDLLRQYRGFVREIDTAVGPRRLPMDEGGLFTGSDVLSLKNRLIDQSVAIAERQTAAAARDVLRDAADRLFRLQAAHRTLDLLTTNRVLASQMLESATARLQAGQVTQADVLKTRTLLDLLDNRIAAVREDEIPATQADLLGLLDLPPDTPLGPWQLPDRDLTAPAAAQVAADYPQSNQELAIANLGVDRMATMLRMAGLMIAPGSSGAARLDLNAGADAGPTRSMMAAFPESPAPMSPPADFTANQSYLQELAHRLSAARHAAADLRSRGRAQADARLHALAQAARSLQTLDTTVPRARQTFDILKANYAAGNVPLVEFLDAGRDYFDQTLMREAARRDLNLAWADLEALLGRTVVSAPPAPAASAPPAAAPAHPAAPLAPATQAPGDPRP